MTSAQNPSRGRRAAVALLVAASLVLGLTTLVVASEAPGNIVKLVGLAAPDQPLAYNCAVDTGGANDISGQKDMNEMCADYSVPGVDKIRWNWDDTGWTDSNTGDACSLYDSDGDGFADRALCVSVGDTPSTFQSMALYSCDDSSTTHCLGAIALTPSAGTGCTASVQALDPFSAGYVAIPPNLTGYPPGDNWPDDTVAECTIVLTDVNNGRLLDVCAYSSHSLESNTSDCVLYRPQTGKLEVTKVLPSNVGLFNLQIDGVTVGSGADVGNGGTTGTEVVPAGNHSVGETAGTGTTLASYVSDIYCADEHGIGPNHWSCTDCTSLPDVPVADEADVLCTITNTLKKATLVVIKHVVNDDGGTAVAGDFSMAVTGGNPTPAAFPGAESPGTTVVLDAGTYGVSETGLAGYSAAHSTDCSGTIIPGETKTCTVTNVDIAPKLIVIKHVINNSGGTAVAANFTMTVDDPGTNPAPFPGAEAPGTQVIVDPGAYSVSETGPSGYAASYSADCTGTLAIGQTKTCTVTNVDVAPTLKLVKSVTNNDGGNNVADDWTLSATAAAPNNGRNFSNKGGSGAFQTVYANAAYVLSESGPAGYSAGTWSCTGGSLVGSTLTLTEGDTGIVCTITNDDIAPTLKVCKYLEPAADSGRFNLLIGSTLYKDNAGNGDCTAAVPMMAGVMLAVTETAVPPANLSDYFTTVGGDCALDGTITLGLAENKTCTFTNRLVSIAIDKQIALDPAGPWRDSLSGVAVETLLYYRFVVANSGGVDLENVTVTDPVLGAQLFGDPAHIFCTIQGITAGASEICGPFGPTVSGHTGPGTAYSDGFVNTATASGCYMPAAYNTQYCRSSDDSASYSEGRMRIIGYLPFVMR